MDELSTLIDELQVIAADGLDGFPVVRGQTIGKALAALKALAFFRCNAKMGWEFAAAKMHIVVCKAIKEAQ